MTKNEIQIINQLVGEFSESHIRNLKENLEFYLHPELSMFIPVYKYCEYAVSANHSHPAYSFIYNIKIKGHFKVHGKKIVNASKKSVESTVITLFPRAGIIFLSSS